MTRLRKRRGLRTVRRHKRQQRSLQLVQSLSTQRTDRDRRHIAECRTHFFRAQHRFQITLAENNQLRRKPKERFAVLLRQRACAIQHQHAHIRFRKRFTRPLHADALNRISGFAQSGRIRQQDADSAHLHGFGQRVSRRAGNIRHDCPLAAQQRIQQAALARVGSAAKHDAQPFILNAPHAGITRLQQPLANRLAAVRHLACGLRFLHLIRKIHCGGKRRQQRRDVLPRPAHKRGNAALHLPNGTAHRPLAARTNHPHDALCLRQVDAPVHKRPAGEFARLCHPRARLQQQQQDAPHERL